MLRTTKEISQPLCETVRRETPWMAREDTSAKVTHLDAQHDISPGSRGPDRPDVHAQSCAAWRRGYVLRNVPLGNCVTMRTSQSALIRTSMAHAWAAWHSLSPLAYKPVQPVTVQNNTRLKQAQEKATRSVNTRRAGLPLVWTASFFQQACSY